MTNLEDQIFRLSNKISSLTDELRAFRAENRQTNLLNDPACTAESPTASHIRSESVDEIARLRAANVWSSELLRQNRKKNCELNLENAKLREQIGKLHNRLVGIANFPAPPPWAGLAAWKRSFWSIKRCAMGVHEDE